MYAVGRLGFIHLIENKKLILTRGKQKLIGTRQFECAILLADYNSHQGLSPVVTLRHMLC